MVEWNSKELTDSFYDDSICNDGDDDEDVNDDINCNNDNDNNNNCSNDDCKKALKAFHEDVTFYR